MGDCHLEDDSGGIRPELDVLTCVCVLGGDGGKAHTGLLLERADSWGRGWDSGKERQ